MSTVPAAGGVTGPGATAASGAGPFGAEGAAAIPSPNPLSASSRRASIAAWASGPAAVTLRVSPNRAPSATRLVRLPARTGVAAAVLGHAHVGVEAARRLHEPRCRAGVQPDGVADLELGGDVRPHDISLGLGGGVIRNLTGLHRQRVARLRRHLLQRRTTTGGSRGGHGALHQRRCAQLHGARRVLQHLHGELGTHERAPEVHQHEHAIRRHGALDRCPDALGVSAEDGVGGIRVLDPARRLNGQIRAAHLAGQAHDTLSQGLAMRDDDEPYHYAEPLRPRPYARCR